MNPSEESLNADPTLHREQHATGSATKHLTDLNLANEMTVRLPGAGTMVFNRYRLQRVLGRGGMGVVWLAEDTKLNRAVALKFLPDIVGADAAAMQELMDETRRGLDLAHPNIVRIYDLVTDDQAAAISMEFVDGRNLSERRLTMPHGVFTVAEVTPWLGHLCSALDYAHVQKRIVHRDLKPANLMLDKQGELKIADFGIARNVSDAVSRLSVSMNAGTSGTLPYMSPQQTMGDQPRPTDDLYSLGATLFELFTGKPPFYSGNITAQVTSKKAPTIRQRREELFLHAADIVPQEWEEAIAACLHKEPEKRPQTAGELARRLGLSQDYTASPARPVGSKKSGWKNSGSKPAPVAWKEVKTQSTPPGAKKKIPLLAIVLVSVASVLLIGGVGAGVFWWRSHRPPESGLVAHFDVIKPERIAQSKAEDVEIARSVAAPQETTSEKSDRPPVIAASALPSAKDSAEPSGTIPVAQSPPPGGPAPVDPVSPPSGSALAPDRAVAMTPPVQPVQAAPPEAASVPAQNLAATGSVQAPAPQVSPPPAPSPSTIPPSEPQVAMATSPVAAATTISISPSSRAALLTGGAGPIPPSSTTSVSPPAPSGGPPVAYATGTIPVAPGAPGPPATGESVTIPPQPVVQPPAAGYWTLDEILANSEYGSYSEPGRRYLVFQAQQAMKQDADGMPGKGTYKSIQKFQTDSALQPTGQLDSQTLAALGLSGQPDKADWGRSHRSTVSSGEDEDDDERTPESEKTAARKFIERKVLGGRDLKNIFRR